MGYFQVKKIKLEHEMPVWAHNQENAGGVEIELNCPLCLLYETEFTQLLGAGSIFNSCHSFLMLPYVADNWHEEQVLHENQLAIKLEERLDFIPATIMVGDRSVNIVDNYAPTRFRSHQQVYSDVADEFNLFFWSEGRFTGVQELETHLTRSHQHLLTALETHEGNISNENFFSVVKTALDRYIRLARITETEGRTSPWFDNFTQPVLNSEFILALVREEVFSSNTKFEHPMTFDLQRALNNLIIMSNFFDLMAQNL